MNRITFMSHYFNFCREANLGAKEVIVSAGGGLLMMGFREETSDLDLDVPDKVYNRYLRELGVEQERSSSHGTYLDISEHISIHRIKPEIKTQVINFVTVYSVEELIQQKTRLANAHDRPADKAVKDLLEVAKLEEYLRNL